MGRYEGDKPLNDYARGAGKALRVLWFPTLVVVVILAIVASQEASQDNIQSQLDRLGYTQQEVVVNGDVAQSSFSYGDGQTCAVRFALRDGRVQLTQLGGTGEETLKATGLGQPTAEELRSHLEQSGCR